VVAAGVDLATKEWANYALGNSATAWPAERAAALQRWLLCLDLVWQANPGAVFGSWAGKTAPLIAFTLLALGLLTWLFTDSRRDQRWLHLFLSFIMAGAIGNLYDRLAFHHVRDFLRINLRTDWATWGGPDHYLWPYIFNVADVFITVGVFGLFVIWIAALFKRGHEKAGGPASGS
jgi:lipoprotein signal peptidase